MYTIPITYEDYNGNQRTENFSFHLSKAEIIEMELSTEGGFGERIQHIVDARDTPTLIKIFKELIIKSYGVKSADGRRFEKSEQLSNEFSQTEAFSQLYVKLATDVDAATSFINNIVPRDVAEQVKAKGDVITGTATEVKKFEPQDHKPKQQ
jgi:hypothetical protein